MIDISCIMNLRRVPPIQILSVGFTLISIIGGILLYLPISSLSGEITPFIDALFTATSAVFGFSLAVSLASKGHEVLAIDADSGRIEEIKDLVTNAIVHDVKTGEYLKEYLNGNIDTVILNLGETIEANSLAIYHLKKIGIKKIIVKTVNDIQAIIYSYRQIGATEIIKPEKMAGQKLAERLSSPNLIEYIPLAPEYGIFEMALPDKIIGRTIKEIGFRNRYHIEILAIKNILTDTMKFMPDPDSKIEPDSVVLFMCKKEDFDKLSF